MQFMFLVHHFTENNKQDESVNESTQNDPMPSTSKIVPTFGKKRSTKKVQNPTAKPKKFVPPIKITQDHESKSIGNSCTDVKISSKSVEPSLDLSQCNNKNKVQPTSTIISKQSKESKAKEKPKSIKEIGKAVKKPPIKRQRKSPLQSTSNDMMKCLEPIQDLSLQYHNYTENYDIGLFPTIPAQPDIFDYAPEAIDNPINTDTTNVTIRRQKNSLGGVILGSLCLLNDEETEFTQNLSQESATSDCTVKNLSRIQSACSVISLNKTYKNLDVKSFEKVQDLKTCENNSMMEIQNEVYHKIPEGNEFLKLFPPKSVPKKKKAKSIVMATEFGDMGFNMKYSDYIKNFGYNSTNLDGEERVTSLKILQMYTKENEIINNMNIFK